MTLGDIIKDYRDTNGITMEAVAQACGITKGYVSMLEKNINPKTGKAIKPTIETILSVCKGLHLDVNDVFSKFDKDYIVTLNSENANILNSYVDARKEDPQIHTIAAHHDSKEWTQEELDEIEEFKRYVLSKRKE